MEALGFDNIMGAEEIDTLFSDMDDNQPEETGGEEIQQTKLLRLILKTFLEMRKRINQRA